MREKVLGKFKLNAFESRNFISRFIGEMYERTGEKFDVTFQGSRGYLFSMNITCEGAQTYEYENRIQMSYAEDKNGKLRAASVILYYSEERGLRVAIPSIAEHKGNERKTVEASSRP